MYYHCDKCTIGNPQHKGSPSSWCRTTDCDHHATGESTTHQPCTNTHLVAGVHAELVEHVVDSLLTSHQGNPRRQVCRRSHSTQHALLTMCKPWLAPSGVPHAHVKCVIFPNPNVGCRDIKTVLSWQLVHPLFASARRMPCRCRSPASSVAPNSCKRPVICNAGAGKKRPQAVPSSQRRPCTCY
jgi:hypothetical protein